MCATANRVWGPDGRRAAVAIVFETLAGGSGERVSPALPTVLQLLAERDLRATFRVEDDLDESEPLALTLIRAGRHEVRAVGSAGQAGGPVDAAFLEPALVGDPDTEPRGAPAWHQAAQLAIGRALESSSHTTLTWWPRLLERADAFAVLIETLDLIAGLARAGSLWPATQAQLEKALGDSSGRR